MGLSSPEPTGIGTSGWATKRGISVAAGLHGHGVRGHHHALTENHSPDDGSVVLSAVRDPAGFADIGDYAVLGNGRSVALVAADGAVDWWAAPRLDSVPAFAALLDPARGGRIVLRPDDDRAEVTRHYLPDTNVLETVVVTDSGRARVTDSLNSGNAGALPWTELARRVEGLEGRVRFRFEVAPGSGLNLWQPWVGGDDRTPVLHAGELTMAVRCSEGVALENGPHRVGAGFEVAAGERRTLGVVASHGGPLFLPAVESIDERIDLTIEDWRHWSSQINWNGPDRERIVRSALALKLLTMADTGAIAAAATTSLPEMVGGPKNWDYRFSWIRDAALTIDALSACSLEEEVHAAVSWLLRTIRTNGPEPRVMYTLEGGLAAGAGEATVPGYRDSRPVQVGNGASGQRQLGIYGDLFGTVATWVERGHVLDVRTSRELADLADRCADEWHLDDAGIWELGQPHAYTSSKMNCWRGLVRAADLADAGHIVGSARRWRDEAAAVRDWVERHCWSEDKQAYTFYAGTEDLDASVLLGARFGYDRGDRMASTVDAIVSELAVGPLVYRYSGVDAEEQAFIACSYWLVQGLAHTGRVERARRLMEDLDAIAGDLGLLSEMCTPGTGELVGNLPQALSHLALIDAAALLRRVSPA